MTFSVLALILVASMIHAAWNLISKKTQGGASFVMLYSALTCVLYSPIAWYLTHTGRSQVDPAGWGWIALSGSLHFAYALVLQRGYQIADLSVVYPTARGSGPLMAVAGAVFILGESPSWQALGGAVLITCGIFFLSRRIGTERQVPNNIARGVKFGFATGLCTALYTIVDAFVVRNVGLAPLVLDYLSNTVRTMLLMPAMFHRRKALTSELRLHGQAALAVAALSPLSYILVLYAMRLAPITHVAPVREVSMLFGVLAGSVFLGERHGWLRFLGGTLIVSGVILLSTRF